MNAFKKGFQACCFDGVKRHTVNPRCPVIPLGHLVGLLKRFHLADVNIQSPKPPGLVGLRLQVNLPPQVLQTDGRLYHLALASRVVGRSLAIGLLRSPVITRFIATTNPSATLSSSANFPGPPVIWPTLLRQFLGGTRRASPVAQHVLATVLSLPPRRSDTSPQPACGASCCLRPTDRGLGLRGYSLSGPPLRSLSLRPGDSLTIPWMALSMGFRYSVSLLPAIQATGSLALTLARLTLAEHASLRWTHNRT